MSNLIQMPPRQDLLGRMIGLNLSVCRKFTCRGFFLSPNRPAAMVDEEADQDAIRNALLQGRLVDVTDQPNSGLRMGDTMHSPAKVEDTGEVVFLGYDKSGRMFVAAPKDEQEAKAMEEEIRRTGTLQREWNTAAELSQVSEILVQDEVGVELKPGVPNSPEIIITDS